MKLHLITIFTRLYHKFCSLYTPKCRIIQTTYFWHAILQDMHACRKDMHPQHGKRSRKLLKKRKTNNLSARPIFVHRSCTTRTRALYGRYKAFVASVQGPCSLRTRPPYKNKTAKSALRSGRPRSRTRPRQCQNTPEKPSVC